MCHLLYCSDTLSLFVVGKFQTPILTRPRLNPDLQILTEIKRHLSSRHGGLPFSPNTTATASAMRPSSSKHLLYQSAGTYDFRSGAALPLE